ncbi:MAG: hypothetical protein ICV70_00870 [Jiangellaceae bacterium]|nr:hypothetical protein [Jiangellaceae bacterium]
MSTPHSPDGRAPGGGAEPEPPGAPTGDPALPPDAPVPAGGAARPDRPSAATGDLGEPATGDLGEPATGDLGEPAELVAPPPVPPVPVPPSSLLAAVKLMYVGAGLSLLGMLFSVATRAQLRDQMEQEDQNLTPEELDRAVDMATGVTVVIGVIAIAFWLWMAQANRRGEAWARIVASVLFGLDVLLTGYNLAQTTGFGVIVNIASIALAGAILWLLYRKDSSAYYAAMSARQGG